MVYFFLNIQCEKKFPLKIEMKINITSNTEIMLYGYAIMIKRKL